MNALNAIPEAALAHHIAILGKTGSGKTSTEKVLVEHVVARGFRVCVLDTLKSDWWGITSSSDGRRPGLPFCILGGPRGHVPLHSSAGAAIGRLVGGGDLPLSIIDMADFEAGGIQRFFVEFAQSLWKHARGVIYLVIEEAHEIAPKERAGFGAENLSIHWAKKLATGSRTKGIRIVVATQRVQALHNAVLGSCETLIAHRLMLDADQKAVLSWLKNANKAVLPEVEGSLSSLPTGTGWVCSGEAQFFQRVQFPKFETYDNTATPTGEDEGIVVKTASVDQAALRAIIGDAVKEAEANDPKTLRAEIDKLRKQLAAPGGRGSALVPDRNALEEAEGAGYRRGLAERQAIHRVVVSLQIAWDDCAQRLSELREACRDLTTKTDDRVTTNKPLPPREVTPPRLSVAKESASPGAGGAGLSGPQRQLLQSLAWWRALGHDQPTRVQVATICGWRVTSGHLKNVAGSLRSKGLIDYPNDGTISLTEAGAAAAPEPDTSATLEGSVIAVLTGPQRQVFAALPTKGRTIAREDIAKACGWEPTSGHVKNVLGSMRSLEVIDYPAQGHVARAGWLR